MSSPPRGLRNRHTNPLSQSSAKSDNDIVIPDYEDGQTLASSNSQLLHDIPTTKKIKQASTPHENRIIIFMKLSAFIIVLIFILGKNTAISLYLVSAFAIRKFTSRIYVCRKC
jgi:hypothetical protein